MSAQLPLVSEIGPSEYLVPVHYLLCSPYILGAYTDSMLYYTIPMHSGKPWKTMKFHWTNTQKIMKFSENTEIPRESLQTRPDMLEVPRSSENHVFLVFWWFLAVVRGPLRSLRRAPGGSQRSPSRFSARRDPPTLSEPNFKAIWS